LNVLDISAVKDRVQNSVPAVTLPRTIKLSD